MERCYTVKGQSLDNKLSCIFQTIGNILNLKQKPQNTKVKDTGLMRSQICFFLLQLDDILFVFASLMHRKHGRTPKAVIQ